MTVGKSSEEFWIVVIMPPVSSVLNLKPWWYMKEPVSGIMEGALISVHGMHFLSPEFGNARLGGLTMYPPGGSALTSGCSSIKALVRHLGGAQQQERSLSPPSPATLVARLGCMAQAPAREHCITSPFLLSSPSLSSLLSLFLSPAVPWFHQISEGHPASRAAPVLVLCGLNF